MKPMHVLVGALCLPWLAFTGGCGAGDGTAADSQSDALRSPLEITTTSLPGAQLGSAYSAQLSATGGRTPYAWSISDGALPGGISLGTSSGKLTGTPAMTGTFSFTVEVKGSRSYGHGATRSLSISVAAPASADGGGAGGKGDGGSGGSDAGEGAGGDTGGSEEPGTPITSCQTLGTAGATYALQNDVSATGTCFSVTADDVTLHLNGHTVTYGTANQSQVVAGIMMVECWESAWTGGTIGGASGSACGSFQDFTLNNGTINQGGGTLQAASHVIRAGGNGSLETGPTVFGVTSTWSSPYTQFLATDYGNSTVVGAAVVHDNVLTNHTSAPCAAISCRDQVQGGTILIQNAIATTTPALIYDNTITAGPDGAILCDAPGCAIYGNNINPGTPSIGYANDFAIFCWSSCDAYNNTVMDPYTSASEGRGISLDGVECEEAENSGCSGRNVHDNTVHVIEHANDAEYSGCELGGAYGIQFDDLPANATAHDNAVLATADDCRGVGLRVTDSATLTNVSTNNTYVAVRASGGPETCPYSVDHGDGDCAFGVSLDDPNSQGITIESDTFQADSAEIFLDDYAAVDVTLASCTFLAGATHPANHCNGAQCFVVGRAYGNAAVLHVRDAVLESGVDPDNNDIAAQGSYQAMSVFLDWTQTVTVKKASGVAAAGAAVTYTDALGNTYGGSTNSSGVATVVVTQKRYNNDDGPNGIENRNPFGVKTSLSGCTTATSSGVSISSKGSMAVTLSGC
jgi:hypothetical protein